jgi:hypothetical protein
VDIGALLPVGLHPNRFREVVPEPCFEDVDGVFGDRVRRNWGVAQNKLVTGRNGW